MLALLRSALILVLVLWPALLLAQAQTKIVLKIFPERPGPDQSVEIECLAWREAPTRDESRLKDGLLTLSIFDQVQNRLVSNFVISPTGDADLFGVAFKPPRPGQYRVEAVYSGSENSSPAMAAARFEAGAEKAPSAEGKPEEAAKPAVELPPLTRPNEPPQPPAPTGLDLWRSQADKGDPQTQYELGARLQFGQDISPDPAEAAQWYRRAAERGHGQAQMSLGLLYSEGKGVGQDLVEAFFWLSLAAENLTGPAKSEASALRDLTMELLSTDQIDRTQERVKAWKPKP